MLLYVYGVTGLDAKFHICCCSASPVRGEKTLKSTSEKSEYRQLPCVRFCL